MRNKLRKLCLLLLLTPTLIYAAIPKEHYIFRYDNGRFFDVTMTDKTFKWQALTGPNTGEIEQENINTKYLRDEIQVIQWVEKDASFVTVVFDRAHQHIISSGNYPGGIWLWEGKAEKL
jgi:hypothetical protein